MFFLCNFKGVGVILQDLFVCLFLYILCVFVCVCDLKGIGVTLQSMHDLFIYLFCIFLCFFFL